MINLPTLGLHTDLYQLTMAAGYWKLGIHNRQAAFDLFYRENPFGGAYAISCGLETIIDFVSKYRFTKEDLDYLAALKTTDQSSLFDPKFLEMLSTLELEIDMDAIPEGTIVFPKEPLIQVRGSLIQCQLLETALLNLINFPTLIATKASRIVQSAAGDPVVEFGLRRAQGVDGAITATRASFVGGVSSTSNVSAGYLYQIPVRGTHAHSWIMAFDNEQEAFDAYASAMPHNAIFLVDTYDTIEGVRHAIESGKRLEATGHHFLGIRLDSGDLAKLSIAAREMLNNAGFSHAQIMASGDLDEYEIKRIKESGGKVDVWGVGTRLVTAYDQPAIGGVYKLVAIRDPQGHWRNKYKKSNDPLKQTLPGIMRARRLFNTGAFLQDILYPIEAEDEAIEQCKKRGATHSEPLLQPIFRKGKLHYHLPDLLAIQLRAKEQLNALPYQYKLLKSSPQYTVELFNGSESITQ